MYTRQLMTTDSISSTKGKRKKKHIFRESRLLGVSEFLLSIRKFWGRRLRFASRGACFQPDLGSRAKNKMADKVPPAPQQTVGSLLRWRLQGPKQRVRTQVCLWGEESRPSHVRVEEKWEPLGPWLQALHGQLRFDCEWVELGIASNWFSYSCGKNFLKTEMVVTTKNITKGHFLELNARTTHIWNV